MRIVVLCPLVKWLHLRSTVLLYNILKFVYNLLKLSSNGRSKSPKNEEQIFFFTCLLNKHQQNRMYNGITVDRCVVSSFVQFCPKHIFYMHGSMYLSIENVHHHEILCCMHEPGLLVKITLKGQMTYDFYMEWKILLGSNVNQCEAVCGTQNSGGQVQVQT
jgi:hypothetical protein